nr:hypothetical protein CTI12_AA105810 [Tanacetum cinerariifolium]
MKHDLRKCNRMELFTEHHCYDVLQYNHNDNLASNNKQSDVDPDYDGESDPENVDFHTKGEQGIEFAKLSVDDPFLNKLVEDEIIDGMHKADKGIKYPVYDPEQHWNENKPVLGIRVVFCGRDLSIGRCASKKKLSNKHTLSPQGKGKGETQGNGKGEHQQKAKEKGKGKMDEQSQENAKWTKARVLSDKGHACPFRFWASWMQKERSFQIKTIYSDHKCARDYNLGSLVTFRWIAQHDANEIIQNSSIPTRFMINDIRKKFLINVSLGQFKRAKKLALYEHEEGLIKHYGKLWEYRQVVLESNPVFTCHIDQEVLEDDGKIHFTRMYVCFKGLKDGWLAGCRRVIGLDGCFLTHYCKGELLTVVGRDANNQMFPIAWAIVKIENKNNWCWFLSLLCDDLDLQDGLGITIISDGHKIKTIYSDHKCARDYNLGSLVTFRWIAQHDANEIIQNSSIPTRFMINDIRKKFLINVSLGQFKRAKKLALYEHEEGLIKHYGKLWEYRQVVLESNPVFTCHIDQEVLEDDGKIHFTRMYVCFKGLKDGWLAGCRRVIGLDGCFLTHYCKGELLTVVGRDANNQMFPIAWAIVKIENKNNWCWFLSLLCDDLDLQDGLGITIISDGHKRLVEAVKTWLHEVEHRHCDKHIYANFKKKLTGVLYNRLFWAAASSIVEQNFLNHMDEIKRLDPEAYDYLMRREPGSWCKAFFQLAVKCASFENGMSESFNSRLVNAKGKPIITMLEDIRVYVMQRNWALSKQASYLDDNICPSIRKKLNVLKKQQSGSKMWKSTSNIPPLPPFVPKMPGRPQKKRIRHPTENDHEVSQQPKPPKLCKPPKPPSNKQYSRIGRIKITNVGGSVSRGGGSSSKRGGGSVGIGGGITSKRGGGSGLGRGGGSTSKRGSGSGSGRAGGSVGRASGSTSKRGGGSGVGRAGGSVGRGGGSTSKRGGGLGVGRAGGSVGRGGGGGACNSKRGGRSITSKGSGSVGRGGLKRSGSNSMDTEEEQFRKDQEAEREVMEEVRAAKEKERLANEQYARTYCDWEDFQWEGGGFEEPNLNLRLATMSDLVAADEAHNKYFNSMPSHTNDVSLDVSHTVVVTNNVVVPNNEQPTPDALQTSSQSSRVVLHPRPVSERITKRRKVNLAAGTTSDNPFTL